MPFPTSNQIRAVRKALYKPERLRRIASEHANIIALMNLDPNTPLQPGDIRVVAGAGPLWYIPANGKLDPGVKEAANRCNTMAALIQETRRDVAKVSFPRPDKSALLTALAEEAAVWRERGRLWRAAPPGNVQVATAKLGQHQRASIQALTILGAYLMPIDLRDYR